MDNIVKIKFIADMSAVKQTISKAKKEVASVSQEQAKQSKKATQGTNADLAQVKSTLESIQSLNFWQLIRDSFKDSTGYIDSATKHLKSFSDWIKTAGAELKETLAHIFGGKAFKDVGLPKFDFGSAKESLKEFGKSWGIAFGKMKGAVASLGHALGSALKSPLIALAAIVAMIISLTKSIKNAISVGKQVRGITTEAAKIGMTTGEYERWGYVLHNVGIEADNLKDFIKTLSSEQLAAREGNEDTIKSFERLGISQERLATMGQSELFAETVKGLQNVEDQVERTALAYKIFGEEDAANVANLLALNNREVESLIHNYSILAGAPSERLIERSATLHAALGNLSTAWQGLRNTLAEIFLPAIIAVSRWLVKLTVIINTILRTVFGVKKANIGDSFSKASVGVSTYSGAVDTATKSMKELKRSLMGFDELNVLDKPDNSSASGGGATQMPSYVGGGVPPIDSVLPDPEDLGLDGFIAFMEKYGQIIRNIVTISMTGIGAIGTVISLFSGNIPGALFFAAMAGIGIASGFGEGGLWTTLGETFKKWGTNIKNWFKTNILPAFTKKFWKEKWGIVSNHWHESCESLREFMSNTGKKLKAWFKNNILVVFTKKYWLEKWENIKAAWHLGGELIKAVASNRWESIKEWFNEKIRPVFTKKYWVEKWGAIKSGAADRLESAKEYIYGFWDNIKGWFARHIKPVFTISYWKNKFMCIKDGAKSAFNGAMGIIESAVNRIIAKINTLHWDIPEWVPVVGGERFGFDINPIHIPRLATGGIATKSTLANIGEAGKEAILPLENNTGWMDKLADKIAARNGQAPTKIVLNVDGHELGWAAINNINRITEQNGGLALAL